MTDQKDNSLLRSCSDCVIYELRPESIGLSHDNPSEFIKSQWPVNHKVYILYRMFVACGFTAWIAADILYESQEFYKSRPWDYLIYATNWSFILLGLTIIFQSVTTCFYSARSSHCLDRQTFERMPIALKVQWLLQNLGYNSALVVTASYWSFIVFLDSSRVLQSEMSRIKHTLNSVYVVVDILISGAPFRVLHLLYTVGLGSVYSLFNAAYFLNDGTILEGNHYAYNLLDWRKPAEAIVTCILCVIMCVFSQIILYQISKLRSLIFSKIYFRNGQKPESETEHILTEPPGYMTMADRIDSIEVQE
ncbi:hypothetical protein CHS0354_023562 [Potamilus streckersoni]|uniref:Protein rolling stone n=1 Tax=Potamilus streckersoni TaxID=2493646 RepID=A0AAE0S8D7_9BIVA|nr:hypothetical protein CHS0354_023562 [Potamilus streckersoni]